MSKLIEYKKRPLTYRDRWWFHDIGKLWEFVELGWFLTKHEDLPSRNDKEAWAEVDPYFVEEMKLEAKGWRSFSVGMYSEFELAAIKGLVAEFPKHSRVSRITPGWDIFPILGQTKNPSFTITVHPTLVDVFTQLLSSFARPHLIVTTKPIPRSVRRVLPPNHRIVKGEEATAISYDLVSPEAQKKIIALHEHDLRVNKEPPLVERVLSDYGLQATSLRPTGTMWVSYS